MRIAIDYTPAVRERAGIGRFTRGLVNGLAQLTPSHEICLLVARDAAIAATEVGFDVRRLPLPARALTLMWQRARIPVPIEAFAGRLDVFHSPSFVLPPILRAKGVVTIHDLSFVVVPECAEPSLVRYLRQAVPLALARASAICADSESTKNDLLTYFDVDQKRIWVVPGAVDELFRRVEDDSTLERVAERYHLSGPFVLFVGTLEPRKNLSRLAAAFRRVRARLGLPHRLVLAGAFGWRRAEVMAGLDIEADDAIRLAGFVDDADLPALYSLADAFVYPALYEGFGLPVLEALACGTPTVCGNESSLPEVAGDAAIQVAAESEDALADAIEKALADKAFRAAARRSGPQRAARFSWRASAVSLLAVYESVV